MLDEVQSVHIRLYESTESDDPISQWSPEVSFDEAISHPDLSPSEYQLAKRFSELEKFRFPSPIVRPTWFWPRRMRWRRAALHPHEGSDVKIGGNEIRSGCGGWHKLGYFRNRGAFHGNVFRRLRRRERSPH